MIPTTSLDPATLPQDRESLTKLVLEYATRWEQAERKIQERDERLAAIEVQLRRLARWQFGQKTERVPEGQLIFAWYGTVVEERLPDEPPPRAPRARTRPKRGGYRVLPKDLPRRVETLDLPPGEKPCPKCKKERKLIGYEETRQLDFEPASFFEFVLRRAKYVCDPCEGNLATAPLPVPVGPIERGLPGFGLLAQIVVAKFCDHIPCYRQSGIYARHGVELPRQTLSDWVGQAAELLSPIVERMKKDVLLSKILATDDTVMRLWVRGAGSTIQARLWGYLGDAFHNQVVYEFTPDRKQEHPLRFLEKFKGKVQADAYKGYDKLFLPGSEREELGCWAHGRRHVYDARDTDPERGSTTLGFIRGLYEVEWEAAEKKMDAVARAALRREKALPILGTFRTWIEAELVRMLPQSPMALAFGYILAQWEALKRYIDLGEARIDNNAMERRLRGPVMGRRNYLFVGSPAGGDRAAVCYSLVESCKLNGVEPYRYLKDVLRRVWTHPASKIEDLMPRLWKPPPEGP